MKFEVRKNWLKVTIDNGIQLINLDTIEKIQYYNDFVFFVRAVGDGNNSDEGCYDYHSLECTHDEYLQLVHKIFGGEE